MARLRAGVALGVFVLAGCGAGFGAGSLQASRYVRGARQIAVDVDAAVAQNRLKRIRDSVECDNGSVIINATLYSTPSGIPQKYLLDGGSSESSEALAYYYDPTGKLRLVDSEQRSGGSRRTSHLYYNGKGKLEHKDEKVDGPKTTFSDPSEITNPQESMKTLPDPDHGCRRIRPAR